jgi:hypothetical protein
MPYQEQADLVLTLSSIHAFQKLIVIGGTRYLDLTDILWALCNMQVPIFTLVTSLFCAT